MIMEANCTITVFTATYNRAHTLHLPYQSLCAQTRRDFEWLIVDDGSTDGTAELITQWQREAEFPIHYVAVEHGGKHIAWNHGLPLCRGEFFIPLDSDDGLLPDALAAFVEEWERIPQAVRTTYCGIYALNEDQDGKLIGSRWPEGVTDSNLNEMLFRYGVHGDKCCFLRTEVVLEFPFPELRQSTSYLPESVILFPMARRYRSRFMNRVVAVVLRGHESLSQPKGDAVTLRTNQAPGLALLYRSILNDTVDYFQDDPRRYLRSGVQYVRYSLLTGDSCYEQWSRLTNLMARLIFLATLLPGVAFHMRDLWMMWRSRDATGKSVGARPANLMTGRVRSIANSVSTSSNPPRKFASLVLKRSGLAKSLTIPQEGFRLRFYPTSISAQLWCDPHSRDGDLHFIRQLLRPGGTYVDCGANIGQLALAAAGAVAPGGQVFAIEPHPRTFACLSGNLALNPHRAPIVHAVNAALGERDGEVAFTSFGSDDQNRIVAGGDVQIPLRRLDTLLADSPSIDLLKIDVEGYEYFVLLGALGTLPRVRVIFFEYYQRFFDSFQYDGVRVIDLLTSTGFQVFIDQGGRLRRVLREAPPTTMVNLIAVRDLDAFLQRTGYALS